MKCQGMWGQAGHRCPGCRETLTFNPGSQERSQGGAVEMGIQNWNDYPQRQALFLTEASPLESQHRRMAKGISRATAVPSPCTRDRPTPATVSRSGLSSP